MPEIKWRNGKAEFKNGIVIKQVSEKKDIKLPIQNEKPKTEYVEEM